ncbi:hypothetical protein CK623_07710 [Vandammella animalimorsus]|uniref:Acyltransferase 3 domain-containing protein n=1 Tax=Vandammella animalimorsus TaxID=2029117 RepID=A0A2A2AQN5_9BURK|nr:hypothetical protein CK623_07710 [Vandammella animalimorsus]
MVLLHVAAGAVVYAPLGSANWWAGNAWDAAMRGCVPVFVMLSGCLLLTPYNAAASWQVQRQRLARLLVPLLFWGLFYNAWLLLQQAQGLGSLGAAWQALAPGLAQSWLAGAPHFHLWFLSMLAGLYLLTPWLARRSAAMPMARRRTLALALLAIAALLSLAQYGGLRLLPTLFCTLWLPFLGYYLYGSTLQQAPARTPRWPAAAALLWGLAALATMLGLYAVARRHGLATGLYFYDYLSPGVIAMSLAAAHLLRRLQRPLLGRATSAVARHTLGIYLLHPLVLDVIGRHGLLPAGLLGQWDFIPLAAACALLVSLLLSALLARLPGLRRVV